METGQSKLKFVVIINSYSKKKLSQKKMNFLLSSLNKKFDIVDIFYSYNIEDFKFYLLSIINKINGLFLLGGDGSVSSFLNLDIVFPSDFKVGFIPFGTLNDTHKNINGTRNFYKTIKMILKNEPRKLNMMNINNKVNSLYSISFGTFSSIPFLKRYKKYKRLSYYFKAISILFSKRKKETFYIENKEISSYFLFVLKGKYMGGFSLFKHNNLKEDNFYVSYSKMNFLKGLPSYFLPSNKRIDTSSRKIKIKFIESKEVSIDGEKYLLDELNIVNKSTPFEIFSFIK
ncbi:MAG: diacylglycerol kinase family protein [Bacilli bacterium]